MKLPRFHLVERRAAFARLVHRGHWFAHASYLGLVAVEGHIYSFAALALLVLMLIGHFLGEDL